MVDKNIIQSRFTKLGVVPIDNQHYLYATLDNNLIGIIVVIKTCDNHYYDEDDIKVKDVKERVEVVAPTTVQEPVVQEPVKEEKPEPVKQKSARKKTKQELQKIFDSRQLSLFDM